MKISISILLLSVLILLTLNACKEKEEQQNEDLNNELIISGKLIEDSGCNSNKSATVTDAESCIEYYFDSDNNILSIQHLNTGFNCCPDSLYCSISESNDTIYIEEYEKEAGCRCNCLYDFDIEIEGVVAKEYTIKFIEPYALDEENICFNANLKTEANGSICVDRTNYPWGIEEIPQLEFEGELTSRTNCKGEKSSTINSTNSNSTSCISYNYNQENNELLLTHINAGFNCCPDSLYCEFSLNADTIFIQEFENGGMCDCNCLYDFDIKLSGIEMKKYTLKVVEPYAHADEKINIEIDLATKNEDILCVNRNHYPWGM